MTDSDDSDNDSDPNDKEQQDQDLLDHAIYCAARATCRNVVEAESWYKVVQHRLRMRGIKGSSVYCHILDGRGRRIWQALNYGAYSTASGTKIQEICNTIQDVHEGCDKIYPVSFGLEEDDTLIAHNPAEQRVMQVLWTSCVFMKHLQPKHWCNDLLGRLRLIDCSSVPALTEALECGDLNEHLEAANCAMLLHSTKDIISKALRPGLLGTNTGTDDIQLDFLIGGC